MARKASERRFRRCKTRWRLRESTSRRRRPAELLRALRGVAVCLACRRLRYATVVAGSSFHVKVYNIARRVEREGTRIFTVHPSW